MILNYLLHAHCTLAAHLAKICVYNRITLDFVYRFRISSVHFLKIGHELGNPEMYKLVK